MSDVTDAAAQFIRNSVYARSEDEYRQQVSQAIELLCQEIERLEKELAALKAKG